LKKLIILRHGEAVPHGRMSDTDHSRVLTEVGRAQAHSVGEKLAGLLKSSITIVSSDAARALQTAQIVHSLLPGSKLEIFPGFYSAGYREIAEVSLNKFESTTNLIVVGHNPGWSDAVDMLSGSPARLGTAHAAILLLDSASDWQKHLYDCKLAQILTP
jgi:phosphohistidine phosphatase